jgi:hypothetical protein
MLREALPLAHEDKSKGEGEQCYDLECTRMGDGQVMGEGSSARRHTKTWWAASQAWPARPTNPMTPRTTLRSENYGTAQVPGIPSHPQQFMNMNPLELSEHCTPFCLVPPSVRSIALGLDC